MTPTPQQQAIYDAVAEGESHLCVSALAGAGKTTTAVEAARRVPRSQRTGMVAFNKHIAAELQARLGPTAQASTLHALGRRALLRRFPLMAGGPDARKPDKHLDRMRPEWFWTGRNGARRPREEAQAVLSLARLAKCTLTDEDSDGDLQDMADHYGVDLAVRLPQPELFSACRELIRRCALDQESYDFDDMVWLPVRLGIPLDCFDVLLVDESQDLNRCQQALARAAVNGGRLVMIGDAQQAIYGFTGSDSEAMPRLAGEMTQTTRGLVTCPLTVTWRCPKSHVALAQKIVPELEAAPSAIEGDVLEVDPDNLFPLCTPGSLVICRTNGPLVSLALSLIARGVPAQMRGRDIGKGLLDLLDRLRPKSNFELIGLLSDYLDAEVERLERRNAPESAVESVKDRVGCLSAIAAQYKTIQALRDFIVTLFPELQKAEGEPVRDTGSKCWLSSVHRAKGLEADRVIIVEPERLPMIRRDAQAWQNRQEWNLLYIALTRSKRQLMFAGTMPKVLS